MKRIYHQAPIQSGHPPCHINQLPLLLILSLQATRSVQFLPQKWQKSLLPKYMPNCNGPERRPVIDWPKAPGRRGGWDISISDFLIWDVANT
jgi:hypothetical protein